MSYKAPEEFVEKLEREFPGYRVRWSLKSERWQIEMPVGRGALPGTYPEDTFDDGTIRAAEGYWLILEVSPREITKCPDCGFFFKLPHLKIAEARCKYCVEQGRDGFYMLGYFPLGEALLNQLRKTDPKRDGLKKMAAKIDAKNKARLKAIKANADDVLHYAMKENKNDVFENLHFGYNKPAAMWTNGPESPAFRK